ncbi:MAG: sulfatase/phosphatase domain-containing protein, partial [Rufibacter sp.]
YPTFVELGNGKNPAGYQLDGVSLAPLLTQGQAPARQNLFWHYPSETGKWKPRMSSAVRQGDYKLIQFYAKPRVELYNLKADPSEKNDLAAQMPDKVKELQQLLDTWKKEVNAEKPVL